MNQTVIWSFAILGLFMWMLFRPYSTAPWKVLGAFGLLLASGPLMIVTLNSLISSVLKAWESLGLVKGAEISSPKAF